MKQLKIIVFVLILIITLPACASNPSTPPETSPKIEDQQSNTIEPTSFPEPNQNSIQTGQHPYSFLTSTGVELRFLIYIPDNYQSADQWPLILFLHGAERVGKNMEVMTERGGLLKSLETDPNFKFVVVSPQLPSGRWGKYIDPMEELLEHLSESLAIDTNHIYLTGASLGAIGAWQYALDYPDRFAALAPVGGMAPASSSSDPVPDNICTLKNLPIWIFHGEEDLDIRPELNKQLVSTMEACGANIKFTLFPGVNHRETFPMAYEDPALYAWFLEQSK